MKRCWFGAALLGLLLAVSLGTSLWMAQIHRPLEGHLHKAAQAALAEDWQDCELAFDQAWDLWEKWEKQRLWLADHGPTEQISADFAQLEVYCQAREPVAFAAGCRQLAQEAAALSQSQSLSWQNLF